MRILHDFTNTLHGGISSERLTLRSSPSPVAQAAHPAALGGRNMHLVAPIPRALRQPEASQQRVLAAASRLPSRLVLASSRTKRTARSTGSQRTMTMRQTGSMLNVRLKRRRCATGRLQHVPCLWSRLVLPPWLGPSRDCPADEDHELEDMLEHEGLAAWEDEFGDEEDLTDDEVGANPA